MIPPIADEVPNARTITPIDDVVPNARTISPIDDIVPEGKIYFVVDLSIIDQFFSAPSSDAEEAPPVSGGPSLGSLFLVFAFILIIAGVIILYRKPEAREKVFRVIQGTRARMPVVLGGRRRDDSTLLVSNGRMSASAFGSLTDDDDFS